MDYLKLEEAMELKGMWKNYGNENLKATNPNTNYDISKTAGECGIFQLFR
jgi:hypothetical protein